MKRLIYIAFLLLVSISLLKAQEEIKKDVYVVKPYNPSVSDASKINDLPHMDDTIIQRPKVNYFVVPYEMRTNYMVRPIPAAKMMGVPVSKIYGNYVRVGMGNYITPMAEVYVTSLRSKDLEWGVHAFHQSSAGKVTLANQSKAYAGYMENKLDVFGKKIFKTSELTGSLAYDNNNVHQYGYNTALIDTILDKKLNRLEYNNVGLAVRYRSIIFKDSTKLDYDAKTGVDYFTDRYNNTEADLIVAALFNKYYKGNKLAIDIGYRRLIPDVDSLSNGIFHIRPYVSRISRKWKLYAGIDVTSESMNGSSRLHTYPIAYVEKNVLNWYVRPYMGVKGNWKANNYAAIARENPYVMHGLHVKSSDELICMFGGFKGNYSPRITYDFGYYYSVIDGMYFFVNDSVGYLENAFNVVYDDVEYSNIRGEMSYKATEDLSFYLNGNIHKYTMVKESRTWNKPLYDVSFTTHYNLRNKIVLDLSLMAIGKRYVKSYLPGETEILLNDIFDASLKVEYKYSKVLSAFLHLNNMSASRYCYWSQYPSQRFNFMLGVSYAL